MSTSSSGGSTNSDSMPLRSLRTPLALAALCCIVGVAGAQEVSDPKSNSPFSRFGLGDVQRQGFATQSAMGGVGLAYANPHIANEMNPASLGALRFASYQVGVDVSRDVLSGDGVENDGINGNLGYLSLAFTTRNTLNDLLDARKRRTRYATQLAVTPYATQGYSIQTSGQQPEIGTVVNTFIGTGGFYRLRSAHALEIDRRLRLGVSASYLFGRTSAQNRVGTTDIPTSSVITDTESTRVRGVELAAGGAVRPRFGESRRADHRAAHVRGHRRVHGRSHGLGHARHHAPQHLPRPRHPPGRRQSRAAPHHAAALRHRRGLQADQ